VRCSRDYAGVWQQILHKAHLVRLAEWLDQAVAEGANSQADADGMLAKMQGFGVDLLNKW